MASWINNAQTRIVGPATENQLLPTDIEVQGLIELLVANVSAQFDGVSTNNFAEVIGPLKSVAHLGQLSFKIVAEAEAARNADERHAFAAGAESRVNPDSRIVRVAEAGARNNSRCAGILDQIRALRVKELSLAFTEKGKAGLVHRA